MALAHIDKSGKGGKGYDYTYCIMDVEGHASLGRRESLAKAAKEAKEGRIDLCLSNPSFEVWFLSHFERRGVSYGNSDAVIAQLNKCWQSRFATDYEKNDPAIYRRLRDNTRAAIAPLLRTRNGSGRCITKRTQIQLTAIPQRMSTGS
jgi:hypothetical protein